MTIRLPHEKQDRLCVMIWDWGGGGGGGGGAGGAKKVMHSACLGPSSGA